MVWQQIYNPFGNMIISTALAAIPVIVMLGALGFFHIKAHIAAGMGLAIVTDLAALYGGTLTLEEGRRLPGLRAVLDLPGRLAAESYGGPD